jgi:soluble lytic murein transglycosylase-like protein/tetratricopeptide (TPR) repeat protein
MGRVGITTGMVGLVAWLVAVGPVSAAPEEAPPVAGPSPAVPGVVLDELPAPPSPVGPIALSTIRAHLEAGDKRRALRVATAFVDDGHWGRERDAAWLVIGLLHREAERHNLASEAFTKVRAGKGPLAELAAFYEAEQDLARGREWVAIKECETYRSTWPKGDHADACLRVIATAHAKLGNTAAARAAAREYDEDHDNATISEQIELRMALDLVETETEAAIARLQHLAISHDAPLTGRVAEEQLHDLRLSGHADAVLPDDTPSLQLRAVSLRDVKRKDEAWAAFEQLAERAEDDPKLKRWVDDSAERFGWRTHRWDFLADLYRAAYEEDRDPDDAWSLYRVLGRGGRHTDAADVAVAAQKAHAGSREWRRKQEDVGRTMLLAGRYPAAVAQFDEMAARGGWTGRRGKFYAAFASLMAGTPDDAVRRFDEIIEADRSYVTESHYWRSRAHDLLEQTELAQADRDWIRANDPVSWYALLADQIDTDLPTVAPLARSGQWVGPSPVAPTAAPAHHDEPTFAASSVPVATPVPRAPAKPDLLQRPAGFSTLAWSPIQLPTPPSSTVLERVDELSPPDSYRASALHDPTDAADAMARFARRHGEDFPVLRTIEDLASVGLYDLSGPMMSQWFEDWRKSYRAGRAAARRIVGMQTADWRKLFLFSRDHHHAARFTYEWWDDLEDPADQREAWRLAHPLAHDHTVWAQGRRHGIDPYLVMGLMRQESTYNAVAVSRVGASGAMQIMPRTGHLLADLAHDVDFSAGDLEDPTLSITYGITYLGLLMQRFEGAYPLAIASYNGGPFNVSAWLQGTGSDMPMDAFVEHIPFRETRDYVKKVSKGYASYVDLYGPDGAAVVLPPTPRGDHREVVDF